MVKLSVNINKIATLRNARGGDNPSVVKAAVDIQAFGAQGITVHPRPDERHIRYSDVRRLKSVVHTEFNIEGFPNESFIELVLETKPEQVTLVPDPPGVLTSNAGWDTIANADFLKQIISRFKKEGIRTSLFIDANPEMIEASAETGTDRIELYTESYASMYAESPEKACTPYIIAASKAKEMGLGINAGHDLDLKNLRYFRQHVPELLEVSIGHALISDALYYGLDNTVNMYKHQLR